MGVKHSQAAAKRRLARYIRKNIGESGEAAVEVLVGVLKGELSVHRWVSSGRDMVPVNAEPDFNERLAAGKLLLEWGFGKPAQETELTADVTTTSRPDLSKLTDAELVAMESLVAKAAPADGDNDADEE